MKRTATKKNTIFGRVYVAARAVAYEIFAAVSRCLFGRRANNAAKLSAGKKRKLAFYLVMSALPLIQFCIFYLYVNVNSVLMSFQRYDYKAGAYLGLGFDNFARVFRDIKTAADIQLAFKNSFILYAFALGIGTTLSVLFSYYMYKKAAGSRVFKIALFLPSILSAVALVTLYRYFVELGIPAVWKLVFNKEIPGLIFVPETRFQTILFFSIWTGFGTTVLMYTGAMGSINESVVEAAKLDGAGAFRELIHVTLPSIYHTLVTFIIMGIAGLFLNQMNVFTFYGVLAPTDVYTIGYFIFRNTQANTATLADYPYIAAFGILLTVVLVPVALTVKKLLEKFGPSTD